jgi:hypothetical protein
VGVGCKDGELDMGTSGIGGWMEGGGRREGGRDL